MRILAIETSCDETAAAILEVGGRRLEVRKRKEPNFRILSNVVLSQIKLHKPYGGVVPNLAMREHQRNLPHILMAALMESKLLKPNLQKLQTTNYKLRTILAREPELLKLFEKHVLPLSAPAIGAIAVTNGPGLEPALWVGVNFAKALSCLWKKPLIAVNHLEGHIYASFLKETRVISKLQITNSKFLTSHFSPPTFPLLALIVSGGHTELVLMKKHLDYKVLGETLDDAAGEAFDKVARMLGLGYPGGPAISRLAEKWKSQNTNSKSQINHKSQIPNIKLPRPMINSPDLNFSFSGLKTAVFYYLRDNPGANKSAIAYEFQQAVVDVLTKKTADALKKYKPKSLVVGGGVAANQALRHKLYALIKNQFPTISLHISPLWLTGDNAAMIAAAAYFKASAGKFSKPENIKAQGNLRLT